MKKFVFVILVIVVPIALYLIFKRSATEELKHEVARIEKGNDAVTTTVGTTEEKVRDKKPEDVFTSSKAGIQITKVMELFRDLDNPTSEKGKEAWANMKKLRENPKEAFEEIKNSLSSLAPEYEPKKQFLIQFASSLDVDKEEKLNFLSKEMKDSVTNAKEAENIQVALTPSIIFETYSKTAANPEATEKFLLEILPESSPGVQKTLLSAFNKINPKKTDELTKKYGINVR